MRSLEKLFVPAWAAVAIFGLASCANSGGIVSTPRGPDASALRAAGPRTDPEPAHGYDGGTRRQRAATGSETVLYSFAGGSDGAVPANDALLDVNGTFYGVTRQGGGTGCTSGAGCGTVFKTTPSGGESVVYRFAGAADGMHPKGGLAERKGALYGITQNGGYYGGGTFFKVTAAGKHTVLYSFGAPNGSRYDGYDPYGKPIYVAATDTFYGTTLYGGNTACQCGTVFAMTPSGNETLLHSFSGAPDGNFLTGSLLYKGGYLYGTSQLGGSGGGSACTSTSSGVVGCGTIFRVSTSGAEQVLYNFTGASDGAFPDGGLIEVRGKMYGMSGGGFSGTGTCEATCGTVFSVSTSGSLHTIYTFAGPPNDAASPFGNLTDVHGVLYGATEYGGDVAGSVCPGFLGVTGCGAVFRVTRSGRERVLYSFQGPPDGSVGQTTLLYSDGLLYGTTDFGGSNCGSGGGCGTIFSLTP